MDTKILEEIGLTKGEIAVYLALLGLGSSSVGPIVRKAKVSSSKIYPILDRLVDKGLVSFVIKESTRYFESAAPSRLLDYMQEKLGRLKEQEKALEGILPELELEQKLTELKSQAHVFKGIKGFQTAFRDIITSLSADDELQVMGIFDFDDDFQRSITRFHRDRAKKGIPARILLNRQADAMGKALSAIDKTTIRFMQGNLFTPAVFLIYGDKTLISIPKERTFFRIDNERATEAFRAYFESLWDQKVVVYEGWEQVTAFFSGILDDLGPGDEYFVINANQGIEAIPQLAGFFKDFHERRQEKGVKINVLFNQNMRPWIGDIARGPAEVRYLPPDFRSPLQMTFYKDKLYISLWSKDAIGFLITRKDIVSAVKVYFDTLWNQDVRTLRGHDGIIALCEEVIKEGKDLHLLGANASIAATHADYFADFDKRRVAAGITRHHLSVEKTRGKAFNKLPDTLVRYLPSEFSSPLVIWAFGDKVAHVLWERDEIVTLIDNPRIADDYRHYFSLLWRTAMR
ncbi:MAG: helix-turn-helix domain-containing protein [archaeon]